MISTDFPEFDELFDASYPNIETDTYDWNYMPFPVGSTYEDKKQAFRTLAQEYMDNPLGRGLLWRKNGKAINFSVGVADTARPSHLKWLYGLYGPDSNGSMSWTHDPEYHQTNIDYFINVLKLTSHEMQCLKGSPIHKHFLYLQDTEAHKVITVIEAGDASQDPVYGPDGFQHFDSDIMALVKNTARIVHTYPSIDPVLDSATPPLF